MQTLEQWREEKRLAQRRTWYRQQSGRCLALLGLILTFLAIPLAGPIEAGMICIGIVVFMFGMWVGFSK